MSLEEPPRTLQSSYNDKSRREYSFLGRLKGNRLVVLRLFTVSYYIFLWYWQERVLQVPTLTESISKIIYLGGGEVGGQFGMRQEILEKYFSHLQCLPSGIWIHSYGNKESVKGLRGDNSPANDLFRDAHLGSYSYNFCGN